MWISHCESALHVCLDRSLRELPTRKASGKQKFSKQPRWLTEPVLQSSAPPSGKSSVGSDLINDHELISRLIRAVSQRWFEYAVFESLSTCKPTTTLIVCNHLTELFASGACCSFWQSRSIGQESSMPAILGARNPRSRWLGIQLAELPF